VLSNRLCQGNYQVPDNPKLQISGTFSSIFLLSVFLYYLSKTIHMMIGCAVSTTTVVVYKCLKRNSISFGFCITYW
jgi:hypothetical protein